MHPVVSNSALIAGVAAGQGAHTIVLSGVAGPLAGAFSMALGEFASVVTIAATYAVGNLIEAAL